MITGHLDALTPSGFAEGWAYDTMAPDTVVSLRLFGPEEQDLALGLANLHRADLAEAGLRHGWCAFRLRLALPSPVETLKGTRLVLREAAGGAEIWAGSEWRIREIKEPPLDTMARVVARDPTTIAHVQELSGCGVIFADFIARHGAAEFVRTACLYMLGKPAEEARRTGWEKLLRAGSITPFGLLALLAVTEEARHESRLLASPADPGFIFAA